MAERAHWSYSQLSQFLRCPLQYYFQRVLKLTRPFLSSGQALGSAVHQTLAQYHRHLQQGRPGVPVHLAETFHEAWAEQERETIQYRPGENRESVMAQGIALLEAYLQQPPPAGIVAVEREVTVPLQNSRGKVLEKPLVAVLDLVCAAEGELTVVELKTSGRKYSQAQSETSLQATCYYHAVREKTDRQPQVEYRVLVKTKTPQVQRLPVDRREVDTGRLGDLAESVQRVIDAEAFYPVETPLNCSGCPFRQPCRQWQGIERTVSLP